MCARAHVLLALVCVLGAAHARPGYTCTSYTANTTSISFGGNTSVTVVAWGGGGAASLCCNGGRGTFNSYTMDVNGTHTYSVFPGKGGRYSDAGGLGGGSGSSSADSRRGGRGMGPAGGGPSAAFGQGGGSASIFINDVTRFYVVAAGGGGGGGSDGSSFGAGYGGDGGCLSGSSAAGDGAGGGASTYFQFEGAGGTSADGSLYDGAMGTLNSGGDGALAPSGGYGGGGGGGGVFCGGGGAAVSSSFPLGGSGGGGSSAPFDFCSDSNDGSGDADYSVDFSGKGGVSTGASGANGTDGKIVVCFDINECAANNGGCASICVNSPGSFVCQCFPGYTGDQCQTDIDECASAPCVGAATCNDHVDGFNCTCPVGFVGALCETDINECASAPCQHGGTCVDGPGAYACQCPTGWTNTRCDININECSTNNGGCANGATCLDTAGGFTCTCSSAFWIGTYCNVSTDCAHGPFNQIYKSVGTFTSGAGARVVATQTHVFGLDSSSHVIALARAVQSDAYNVVAASPVAVITPSTLALSSYAATDSVVLAVVYGAALRYDLYGGTWSLNQSFANANGIVYAQPALNEQWAMLLASQSSAYIVEFYNFTETASDRALVKQQTLSVSAPISSTGLFVAITPGACTRQHASVLYYRTSLAIGVYLYSLDATSGMWSYVTQLTFATPQASSTDASLAMGCDIVVFTVTASSTLTLFGLSVRDTTTGQWSPVADYTSLATDSCASGQVAVLNTSTIAVGCPGAVAFGPGTDQGAIYVHSLNATTITATRVLTDYCTTQYTAGRSTLLGSGIAAHGFQIVARATAGPSTDALYQYGEPCATNTCDSAAAQCLVNPDNQTLQACTNIDECASSPCLYGGTCTGTIGAFECTCPNGHVGATCQFNTSAVLSSPSSSSTDASSTATFSSSSTDVSSTATFSSSSFASSTAASGASSTGGGSSAAVAVSSSSAAVASSTATSLSAAASSTATVLSSSGIGVPSTAALSSTADGTNNNSSSGGEWNVTSSTAPTAAGNATLGDLTALDIAQASTAIAVATAVAITAVAWTALVPAVPASVTIASVLPAP